MLKRLLLPLLFLLALTAAYFAFFWHWSYASGDRAGWLQKLSYKGWVCKTWEGELVMVSMPGTSAEKFYFTVHDDAVAEGLRSQIGKRLDLHYEQKVGLPTSCFGDTRYFVTSYTVNNEGGANGAATALPAPSPAPTRTSPAPAGASAAP
jgi:hypothetical protein